MKKTIPLLEDVSFTFISTTLQESIIQWLQQRVQNTNADKYSIQDNILCEKHTTDVFINTLCSDIGWVHSIPTLHRLDLAVYRSFVTSLSPLDII